MIKRVYAHDSESFLLQSCILSSKCDALVGVDESDGISLITISSPSGGACTLRILQEAWVGENDIVIHQCILDCLGLCDGQECTVKVHHNLVLIQPVDSCRVHVEFVGFRNVKHWDLTSDVDMMFSSTGWSNVWPKGISSESIMKSLPLCMQGYVLRAQTIAVVQILDSWMIFKIVRCDGCPDFLSSSHDYVEVNDHCLFVLLHDTTLLVDNIGRQELKDYGVSQESIQFEFMRPIMQQVRNCVLQYVELQDVTLLPHCFLVNGPSGSGKSYILNALANELSNVIDRGHLVVVKGSCTRLSAKGWQGFGDAEPITTVTDGDHVHQYLLNVISALDSKFANYNIEGLSSLLSEGQLVVLIDDLDMALRLYVDPDEVAQQPMLLPMNDEVRVLKYFGYYLQYILKELSSAAQDYRIWVVATSAIPPNKLPRSAKGAPEFERIISLPKPSRDDRSKIATSKLSDLIANRSVVLNLTDEHQNSIETQDMIQRWADDLAAITRGFLPADIQSVINRAVLMATGSISISVSESETIQLNWRNLLDAIASVPLKTLQNVDFLSQNQDYDKNYTWEDFAGYADTITTVKRLLRPFAQSTDFVNGALAQFKMPRGMVLHGPSGCGKTLLAKIIAKQLNMNFLRVQSSDLLSKYFGQTEEKIRNLFHIARSAAPSLLFFDDFDALAHKRSNADGAESGHGSIHNRILSTFLNELDGISATTDLGSFGHQKRGSLESTLFVLAACKDLSQLDEALVRPGRLQYHVFLDYPTDEDIRALLLHNMANMPVDPLVDMEDVNLIISGSSVARPTGATIESFCNQLRLAALRDEIMRCETDSTKLEHPNVRVTQRHFDEVLKNMFIRAEDFVAALADV